MMNLHRTLFYYALTLEKHNIIGKANRFSPMTLSNFSHFQVAFGGIYRIENAECGGSRNLWF